MLRHMIAKPSTIRTGTSLIEVLPRAALGVIRPRFDRLSLFVIQSFDCADLSANHSLDVNRAMKTSSGRRVSRARYA